MAKLRFHCPVCHDERDPSRVTLGEFTVRVCQGCTVFFLDPDKFTQQGAMFVTSKEVEEGKPKGE